MKARIIFSAIFVVLVSAGVFAQHVKKQVDPYRYKMEDNKLKLEKTYFSIGNVYNTEVKKATSAIFNDSDQPMEITFNGVPKYASISVSPKILAPKSKGVINLEYRAGENLDHKKKQNWGFQNSRIRLIVNGNVEKAKRNNLSIRANIQEDFKSMTPEQLKKAPKIQFKETVFNFGEVKQGENIVHEFTFQNLGINDLEIRKVKGS